MIQREFEDADQIRDDIASEKATDQTQLIIDFCKRRTKCKPR
jgi:hypothetical protein